MTTLECTDWCCGFCKHYFAYAVMLLPRCMECRRGLAIRILSVCPSVRPSVQRVNCAKTKNQCTFLYHSKEYLSMFSEKKECMVGATPFTWNFGSTDHRWNEITDFEPIIDRSALAVTPSEKCSINTSRKSTTCFSMSLRYVVRCP